MREIIAAAECNTGLNVPVREAPRRAGDPPSLVADPARARARLGLTTPHSDIDTIVRTAWEWYQSRRTAPTERLAV